jgi:hypothetical protein
VHAVVLSLHTSPAAQPGAGDAGGMNVYVSHTVAMLVRAGHTVDVLTCDPTQHGPSVLPSGVTVHHVPTTARTKDEMGAQAEDIARARCSRTTAWVRSCAARISCGPTTGSPDSPHVTSAHSCVQRALTRLPSPSPSTPWAQ